MASISPVLLLDILKEEMKRSVSVKSTAMKRRGDEVITAELLARNWNIPLARAKLTIEAT